MTERFRAESGTELRKREKAIVAIFEKGLDDEEAIGYHGTSLEAVEHLLRMGHLPGASEPDKSYGYEKGDLFFFPQKAQIPDRLLSSKAHDDNREAIEDTTDYANVIAARHYILTKLGLDLGNPDDQVVGHELQDGVDSEEACRITEELIKKGWKRKEILKIIDDSRDRKGVILTLSKDVLGKYKLGVGDDVHDLRVTSGNSLDIKFISGLEPLGQEEWDFFENLQTSISA